LNQLGAGRHVVDQADHHARADDAAVYVAVA
jgi:hypothetical protein